MLYIKNRKLTVENLFLAFGVGTSKFKLYTPLGQYIACRKFSSTKWTEQLKDLDPVVKYNDADLEKVDILAGNRKKVGVYLWINNENGNKYVGSSVSLSVRMYTYYSLRSLAKSNRPIDRALLKYGFSKFSLYILEYCTSENVIEREQYYLDVIKPEYNIVEKAGSTLGYKHTEDSLAKMRNFVLSDEEFFLLIFIFKYI